MATVLNERQHTRRRTTNSFAVRTFDRINIRCGMGETYAWDDLTMRLDDVRRARPDDRLSLFRHGSTNYNDRNLISGQHDTALSADGRRQAEGLRSEVPSNLDLIACSALGRAVETMSLAIPIAVRDDIPVIMDARLNEVHLGDLQGRRRRHLPEFEAGDLDYAPPNGETYRQAAARVFSVVADIFVALAKFGGGPRHAAVFCHAGVLRIVATLASGSDDPKDVFRKTLANAERLDISAASIRVAPYWAKHAVV